ncbi:MAG: radical SAM protein [Phycisphaerae bacterium]
MLGVINKPDTEQKLSLLSTDAQYDLACACGTGKDEHRKRGSRGNWVYPVTLPNGGTSVLFKTLISNVCTNDCAYCPLRYDKDVRRCTLNTQETAKVFLEYYKRKEVFGLFLSSGVIGSADATMEKLIAVPRLLRRKYGFKGYVHLKIIPGCSDAAVEEAISLSNAVSLNIETPGADYLNKLSKRKDYLKDIISPMKLISKLTAKGSRFEKVKQTTQFIVGAAGEPDRDIIKYMWGLYDRLKLQRIYFSAYQKSLGDDNLTGNRNIYEPQNVFIREHRLYQADFLMRKYGFSEQDIIFNSDGNLSLEDDPKSAWAQAHPEYFPVNINSASKYQMLRVPGLGPLTVKNILEIRKHRKLRSLDDIGKIGVRLAKAGKYLQF